MRRSQALQRAVHELRGVVTMGRVRGEPDRNGRAKRSPYLDTAARARLASGKVIRELRRERNVAATELAAATGVTRDTVYNWERGRKGLLLCRVVQIALALEMPVEQLLAAFVRQLEAERP